MAGLVIDWFDEEKTEPGDNDLNPYTDGLLGHICKEMIGPGGVRVGGLGKVYLLETELTEEEKEAYMYVLQKLASKICGASLFEGDAKKLNVNGNMVTDVFCGIMNNRLYSEEAAGGTIASSFKDLYKTATKTGNRAHGPGYDDFHYWYDEEGENTGTLGKEAFAEYFASRIISDEQLLSLNKRYCERVEQYLDKLMINDILPEYMAMF